MSPTPLEEKQKARLKVLNAFYEISDGNRLEIIEPRQVMTRSGLPMEQVDAATQYLVDEGLLKYMTLNGGTSITHSGIREVERAMENPLARTEHFAAVVIQNVFHQSVGAVQTGAGSTAHVKFTVGATAGEVVSLLEALRQAIPPERTDLADTTEDLEAEIGSPAPRPSRIRSSLQFLWTATKDMAGIAQFVLQLAEAYGVQLPGAK